MKNTVFLFLIIIVVSCSTKSNKEPENGSVIVTEFLNDIKSLESIEEGNPILLFREEADEMADKTIKLSKGNIENLLQELNNYSHCVITTADHTIVKIIDMEDCLQSTSWSACMPMAKGYIKKGELEYKKDYLNNIIGIPDSQKRIAYLFK